MRKPLILLSSTALALAACSEGNNEAVYENVAVDMAEPEAEAALATAETAGRSGADAASGEQIEPSSATAAPQIAYRYALGFRLPAAAIKPLQTKHADMCEARGPSVCRIISMQQADQDGEYAYGSLQIAVAAKSARAFSKELETSSDGADATLISSSIQGEDLSKQIVDTEARLRARTLLRDRLMEVLRTRKGTVAELVEAERGVAQVNQEIDQARSWLNEMRGRVAFSQMSISYESGARVPGGFSDPIRNAWGSLGGILGSMIAFLMIATTVILPLGLIAWLAFKLWKRVRKESQAKPSSEA
ncbi:DUF4349 domain-containing protein [Altererythrobacter lutimaris]|nr:DUF4349 domain-containing protein [Altererythrobacter lutimaris]